VDSGGTRSVGGAPSGGTSSGGAASSGGGTDAGDAPSSGGGTDAGGVGPLNFAVAGVAVTKVRANSQGVALLEEKLTSLSEFGPDRRLTLLRNDGTVGGHYEAPPGWALIDFTQHPSGDVSAALATARTIKLVRLDHVAAVRSELLLEDAEAPVDPFYDEGGVKDDNSLLPVFTRDAVRLAAIGENLAVALRTGRNAVVAYRFDYASATGSTRVFRTLVEPGVSIFSRGITSGTFDTFGQLENHWHVHLDADAAGNLSVGVIGNPFAPVFAAHADYFKEPTNVTIGVLLTRLAPDGTRLGTTLVDTVQVSELEELRLRGDDLAFVGRVFTEKRDDGSGWDAYAGHVDRVTGALSSYRTVDLDRGEILFDIAPLAQGGFLVAGAIGYTENPNGASISEQTTPLLAVLAADGTLRERIEVAGGARQSQLRSLAARGSHWLAAGLVNGPGTHSGDGDPALITADGFVHELNLGVR
jgi:hypothetical protein